MNKIYVDELPKSCDECDIMQNLDSLGARDCPNICGITGDELNDKHLTKRHKYCPLKLLDKQPTEPCEWCAGGKEECGRRWTFWRRDNGEYKPVQAIYCPNCGAKIKMHK